MGHYRARDLLLPAGLVSLLRLPLAFVFLAVSAEPWLALAVLFVAGVSDVVDGLIARRLKQATATGAVLDGVLDKLFAAIVLGGLVVEGRVHALEACLLAARELGELPLVVWWVAHRAQRADRAQDPRANWLGKLATVLQFCAIGAVLGGSPARAALIALVAVVGAASAASYWRRELVAARGRRARAEPADGEQAP